MSLAQHPTANVAVIPRRAYITTSAFNTDLYTYTVTVNPTTFVRTGTLAANVTGATALTCPANRILRETGRRLYPDANPGVSTLLVGVYDAVSGLTGLIDPNAPKFAVYNSDKANFLPNGVDPATGLTDQGQPVYTRGTVTAGTGILTSTGQIRCSAVTSLGTLTATANADIDPSLGQVFTLTLNTVAATTSAITIRCPTVPAAGSVVYLIVSVTAIGTQTTFAAGTNVRMVASGNLVASRIYGVTLVSDGTQLVQVGGDVAPAAMT